MSDKPGKISVVTLGCSKNVVDSEELLRQLEANEWTFTDEPADAEIAVINTCGFIEDAKNESIRSILEAVEMKKRGELKKVVVMGCLSERYARQLRKEIPGLDAVIGSNKIDQVVRTLGGDFRYELVGERHLTTPRHFAWLKISEGCDNPCSFCAIPLMRGRHVSKPVERVVLEARRLAALGVRELIIIAQDSTYYGLDISGKRLLPDLIRRLSEIDGINWIRLMYAYPAKFPLELLDVYNEGTKLCRYLDLPIQHIADPVLRSMQRGISSRGLRSLIGAIRERVPGIALRSTLIVGYPNEGEKEFEELLRYVRDARFERLGVFSYSQEDDTSAFPLGDPVPQTVKEARLNAVMELQKGVSLEMNRALVGRRMTMLVDQIIDGTAIGRTEFDAPEIDNEVAVHRATGMRAGDFANVEIVDAEEYDLFAEPAEEGTHDIRPTGA